MSKHYLWRSFIQTPFRKVFDDRRLVRHTKNFKWRLHKIRIMRHFIHYEHYTLPHHWTKCLIKFISVNRLKQIKITIVNDQLWFVQLKTQTHPNVVCQILTHLNMRIDNSNVNHNMIKCMEEGIASLILYSNG
jgi:hypothetical protein